MSFSKRVPHKVLPNPHGPAYATYLHDLEHQGHINLPFTLRLQVPTKRAHECETLPFPCGERFRRAQRNYSFYAVYAYFCFMICARRKKCDTRWELRRSICKRMPTRFRQTSMALCTPRIYTIWNIKVTPTYRLHCVCMPKWNKHMNAKHSASLAENNSGSHHTPSTLRLQVPTKRAHECETLPTLASFLGFLP